MSWKGIQKSVARVRIFLYCLSETRADIAILLQAPQNLRQKMNIVSIYKSLHLVFLVCVDDANQMRLLHRASRRRRLSMSD